MTTLPETIYQNILDETGRALLAQDLTGWSARMATPFQLTTVEGKLVHETARDVAVGFIDFIAALSRIGVKRIERKCQFASTCGDGTISGYHSTWMYREDGTALPEYSVNWTLIQDGAQGWKLSKSESHLNSDNWEDLPHYDLTQFQREDTTAEMRLRRIVQSVINHVDSAFLHGNFKEWRKSYLLPLVVDKRSGVLLIETEDQLKKDFDLYGKELLIHKVTDATRVIRTAEQIDDDLMMATYRAHLICDAQYVVPPWNGALTFRRDDGKWKITKIMNALGHSNWSAGAKKSALIKNEKVSNNVVDITKKRPKSGRE